MAVEPGAREGKAFLREKLIDFQVKIADLGHEMETRVRYFEDREQQFYLELFEILDAFEAVAAFIENKKETVDKTGRMLGKNIGSIHKKLYRLLKSRGIVKLTFSENKARMDQCKVIDTQPRPELDDETILSVVKPGYADKNSGRVIRKAEVITVSNQTQP